MSRRSSHRSLRQTLERLDIHVPPSRHVLAALRIRRRLYRRATLDTFLAVPFFLYFAIYLASTIFWMEMGPASRQEDEPAKADSVVGDWMAAHLPAEHVLSFAGLFLFLMATLGGFSLYFLIMAIWGGVRGQRNSPRERFRRCAVPYVCVTAVEVLARSRSGLGDKPAQDSRDVSRAMRQVAAALLAVHRTRALLHWSSHRNKVTKKHAGLVVARLRHLECHLDINAGSARRDLARALMTVAERAAQGKIGALLDHADLEGLQPVRDRPWLRMAVSILLIGASGAGLAFLELPDPIGPYATITCAMFILATVYGDFPHRLRNSLTSLR